MSAKPARPTKRAARRAANPVKFRLIGGWDLERKLKVPRGLYRATIFTPVDSWDEYIVARDLSGVNAVLKRLFPEGWVPGYEPEIIRLDCMIDSVYLCE